MAFLKYSVWNVPGIWVSGFRSDPEGFGAVFRSLFLRNRHFSFPLIRFSLFFENFRKISRIESQNFLENFFVKIEDQNYVKNRENLLPGPRAVYVVLLQFIILLVVSSKTSCVLDVGNLNFINRKRVKFSR